MVAARRRVSRLVAAAGMHTGSQVAFSATSVLAIATMTRGNNIVAVSRVVAVVAVVAVASTGLKALTISALAIAYPRSRLGKRDLTVIFRVTFTLGIVAFAVGLLTVAGVGGLTVAAAVGFWAAGAAACDLLRLASVSYARRGAATAGVALHLLLSVGAAAFAQPSVASAAVWFAGPHLFAIVWYYRILNQNAETAAPAFFTANWRLCRVLSLEAGLVTVAGALVPLLFAATRPALAVSFQIVNQAVAAPASYIVGGFTVPFAQRLAGRVSRGEATLALSTAWMAITVFGVPLVALVTLTSPANEVLGTLFGPAWTAARALAVPACSLVVSLFGVGVVINSARARYNGAFLAVLMVTVTALGNSVYGTLGAFFGEPGLFVASGVAPSAMLIVLGIGMQRLRSKSINRPEAPAHNLGLTACEHGSS